jgi:hypothetical protein
MAMLQLNDAPYNAATGNFVRDATTEEVTIPGLARVLFRPDLPGSSPLHVFLFIGDHLGSTSSVIDKATGELVERFTYLPYGGIESDYQPSRWGGRDGE